MHHSQNCTECCEKVLKGSVIISKRQLLHSSYFQNLSKWTLVAFFLTTGWVLHYLHSFFLTISPTSSSGKAGHRTWTRSELSIAHNVQTYLTKSVPNKQAAGTQRQCTTAKSTLKLNSQCSHLLPSNMFSRWFSCLEKARNCVFRTVQTLGKLCVLIQMNCGQGIKKKKKDNLRIRQKVVPELAPPVYFKYIMWPND